MKAPQQRSLRGVVKATLEDEEAALLHALNVDLDSTGLSNQEIADRVGIDKAQLHRVRSGDANPPGRLVAFLADTRDRCYVRELCRVAEGEFKPKPPPSPEIELAAWREAVEESGLFDHFAAKVAVKLGSKP